MSDEIVAVEPDRVVSKRSDVDRRNFASWLLLTTTERGDCRTLPDYSTQSGIPLPTLYRWRRSDPIVLEALGEWRTTLRRNLHAVASNLVEAATSKDRDRVAAARLIAELTDEVGPTRVVLTGKVALFDFLAGIGTAPTHEVAVGEPQAD